MPIENIRRFHCRRCDYITEDQDQIAWIEKLGGKCPACHDGEGKAWTKEYQPKVKKSNA